MREGFVYLDEALPGVGWDAKYAGADNFTGARVDGYGAARVVGTRELADALARARELAAARGLDLFLWDAYRPQRAVDCFLRWAALPEDGRTRDKHYPALERSQIVPLGYVAARSGHSRGSAVDLTLVRLPERRQLDMGGGFDLMDESSGHGAQGLSPAAGERRLLLRGIMEACGFRAYEREWWHYALAKEPYPDTYFDFPIA